jgi:hypothetical protein
MTCFGVFAGIPAIVLGAMSRKEIERSQGALGGRGLAAGAVVTGLFGTGLSMVLAVALLLHALEAAHPAAPRSEAPAHTPAAAGVRSYGSLEVVDLDASATLARQLKDLARTATAKGRTVVLQTYVPSSKECDEVALALPDPRMQRALANVTLVRVDIEAYEKELKMMGVETTSAPWFYRIDGSARAVDAISADAWEANVPENMAPMLGDFVRRAKRTPSPAGTAL